MKVINKKQKEFYLLISILVITLSNDNLLTIEQIESVSFPHTHLYIVTLPSQLNGNAIHGNITLSYKINRKFLNKCIRR